MANENEYFEFIFPFSLGCLDENDFLIFKDYLNSGEEGGLQELGEFQNLISLLPTILNIETPTPQTKDNVARRLYKIKDEKRGKSNLNDSQSKKILDLQNKNIEQQPKVSELFGTKIDYTNDEVEEPISAQKQAEVLPKKLKTITNGFEVVKPKKRPEDLFQSKKDSENDSSTNNTNPILNNLDDNKPEGESNIPPVKKTYTLHGDFGQDKKKSDKRNSYTVSILFVLFILLIATGGYYYYQKVTLEVGQYKSHINGLNSKIEKLYSTLSENKDLSEFLRSKNIKVINLESVQKKQSCYGKLLLNFDNSKGFLILSQMPGLGKGMVYQLWLNMKKTNISMGTFNPGNQEAYFQIKLPEITNQVNAKFLLTEEPEIGSLQPGKTVYLEGSF